MHIGKNAPGLWCNGDVFKWRGAGNVNRDSGYIWWRRRELFPSRFRFSSPNFKIIKIARQRFALCILDDWILLLVLGIYVIHIADLLVGFLVNPNGLVASVVVFESDRDRIDCFLHGCQLKADPAQIAIDF